MTRHTFAICAYGESPYLEECVQSIQAQTYRSDVILCTSTPNQLIRSVADKYGIELHINPGEGGITQDWNFALSNVSTKYATVAHQDDIYEKKYAVTVIRSMESSQKPLIGFCDYGELHGTRRIKDTKMLRIKRLMLSPLRLNMLQRSRFIRRRILSLGDPICCPAVTFCMDNMERPIFNNHFRSCEDWEAWESLSKRKGAFVYVPETLMFHRIHDESETSKIINDGARVVENYEMFRKFWPAPIAGILNKYYTRSEDYNKV